ncbi:hypothetical protein IJJ02_00655 [Candidatus Saccharibacteria bacterium]|nr:hypothetical protein [Candidatus Saccharibacteria bacterium]
MDDDFQKLVYARLQALPKGYSISIGGVGDVSKEEALQHVSAKDKIGQLLIAVDRHYFDLIKSGEMYAGITD